jgi:hypothetical protein
MKKVTKILLLGLLAFITVFYGCRKGIQDTQTSQNTAELTEKFFNTTKILKPEVKRIYDYLRGENNKKEFVSEFVKKYGLLDWDKANINKRNKTAYRTTDASDEIVIEIPLTNLNGDYAKGFLIVTIKAGIMDFLLVDEEKYQSLPYGRIDDNILNADDLALKMMIMNKELYGIDKFNILDKKLFSYDFVLGANEKLGDNGTFTLGPLQVSNDPITNARIVTTTATHCEWVTNHHCYGCADPNNCDLYSSGGCPWGTCYDEQQFKCTQVLISYFDPGPDDWVSSSHTGTGGGGGGGTSTVGNPNNGPTSTKPPCMSKLGFINIFNGCYDDNVGWNTFANFIDISNVWDKKFFADKNYIDANQDLKDALTNFFGVNEIKEDKLAAAYVLVSAHKDNRVNGPYDQNFFDYNLKPNLPSELVETNVNQFLPLFSNQKSMFVLQNPNIINNELIFANSILNTFNFFLNPVSYEKMDINSVNFDLINALSVTPLLLKPRPTFNSIFLNALAPSDWQTVANKIGGEVKRQLEKPGEHNTCATRLSYALNYSNSLIPSTSYTFTGDDGNEYIMGATTMLEYLKVQYGTSPLNTVHLQSTSASPLTLAQIQDKLKGKQGIFVMIPNDPGPNGFNATGHVDILKPDGTLMSGHNEFMFAKGGVKEIYLFQLP